MTLLKRLGQTQRAHQSASQAQNILEQEVEELADQKQLLAKTLDGLEDQLQKALQEAETRSARARSLQCWCPEAVAATPPTKRPKTGWISTRRYPSAHATVCRQAVDESEGSGCALWGERLDSIAAGSNDCGA